MRRIKNVEQIDVWKHWYKVENHSTANFRGDIRDPLPLDLEWQICRLEPEDLSRLFIISSDDWTAISSETFRVETVASNMSNPPQDSNSTRLSSDIQKKLDHFDSGASLDTMLIAVTHSSLLDGPFTLIEGNRRSVCFFIRNVLAGSDLYIGVSPQIKKYKWARYTYRHCHKT